MKKVTKRIYGKESRPEMMKGVDKLADVVGSTMGARGRNVIVDKEFGSPLVINDGVSIANEIFFDNTLQNLSAQLVKDAANRTNAVAGDGTTGTAVLARAIIKAGWQAVEEGANPVQFRKELIKASEKIEEELKAKAKKVESKKEAIDIASVSVQDSELGEKIGSLMFDVGANGAVSMKSSPDRGVFIEKAGGMRLEGQLIGGVVENPDKWETKMADAKVLILRDSPEDHEFESKWIPLMKKFADAKQLPNGEMQVTSVHIPQFLVIAEKLSRRFIMAMNANKELIKWVWFRPTTAGKDMKETYKDLQSIIGGQIVFDEDGVYLNKMNITDFGKCETVKADRHELVITVEDAQLNNDRFLGRITDVKGQMIHAEDEGEREMIRQRYANLTGGVATIKVAAATEQDTNELKLRIEDSINATRSAMDEGYLPGGGVALLNAAKVLKDTPAERVIAEACKAPFSQILHNAGYEDKDIDKLKLKDGEGIDVLTDKKEDMTRAGIIDPLKVIRMSLINAVSVAGLLLTSEYCITNEDENDVQTIRRIFTKKD